MGLTVLAHWAEVAGHCTVTDVAVPTVDTVSVMKTRMTGTQGRGRRLAVVLQAHHLLVSADFDQVHAVRVYHKVAQATDETTTPDGHPQAHRQRWGVLQPLTAETTHVEVMLEVERRGTGEPGHHVAAFIVIHRDDTVYAVLSHGHLVWLTVVQSSMCCLELESSAAEIEHHIKFACAQTSPQRFDRKTTTILIILAAVTQLSREANAKTTTYISGHRRNQLLQRDRAILCIVWNHVRRPGTMTAFEIVPINEVKWSVECFQPYASVTLGIRKSLKTEKYRVLSWISKEWRNTVRWKLHSPNFNRFWIIRPCDERRDRRMDGR